MIPMAGEHEAMFRAKDDVQPRLLRLAACITLALGLMQSGCSGMTGLRSVGTDRPSLLGFWDRPEPVSPDPANDYYAKYMKSAKGRAEAMARRSTETAESAPSDEGASKGEQTKNFVAATTRTGTSGRSTSGTKPVRDDSIQVTLGPPEPMPSLSDAAAPMLLTGQDSSRSNMSQKSNTSMDESAVTTRMARKGEEFDETRREPIRSRPGSIPVAKRQSQQKTRDNSGREAKGILASSEARLQSLKTYQVKISRTERVGGRILPEEQIVLSIRREPKAVRLEWADGPNQGREVIYSAQLDDKSLFVHMPKSAIPLPTMKIPVDSPMVMKNSRHSITEAGFDPTIQHLLKAQDGSHKAELGRLAYRGVEKPPGLDRPSHVFTRYAPSGETWTVFLDASTLLPCMVVAKDSSGELNERYIYHDVRENPSDLVGVDAFDPDQRWGQAKGFLSRFARATGSDSPNNRQSTTK